MQTDAVAVTIRGIMAASNGYAVFLGTDEKVFVIYVDHFVGNSIQMALKGVKRERPGTHDLIGSLFLGLGVQLEHVIINDVKSSTFFARILLLMQNELGKKIIELDARPSDSIVLALQQKRPIFTARAVYDAVPDRTEDLEYVLKQQQAEEGETPSEE